MDGLNKFMEAQSTILSLPGDLLPSTLLLIGVSAKAKIDQTEQNDHPYESCSWVTWVFFRQKVEAAFMNRRKECTGCIKSLFVCLHKRTEPGEQVVEVTPGLQPRTRKAKPIGKGINVEAVLQMSPEKSRRKRTVISFVGKPPETQIIPETVERKRIVLTCLVEPPMLVDRHKYVTGAINLTCISSMKVKQLAEDVLRDNTADCLISDIQQELEGLPAIGSEYRVAAMEKRVQEQWAIRC